MGISLDQVFGVHEQAMTLRARRAGVLAANLANADTPGYKARDLDFRAVLADARARTVSMTRTRAGHLAASGATPSGGRVRYRVPDQPSLDGNTVNVHAEQAAFMDNALRYQASVTLLNGRIQGLRGALSRQ